MTPAAYQAMQERVELLSRLILDTDEADIAAFIGDAERADAIGPVLDATAWIAGHDLLRLVIRHARAIATARREIHAAAQAAGVDTGRRVPVQVDRRQPLNGTVPWSTHFAAWEGYAASGHGRQSAERIAERGGFSYAEIQCAIAGHYIDTGKCAARHPVPTGWAPR